MSLFHFQNVVRTLFLVGALWAVAQSQKVQAQETVISAVECRVKDAGDLFKYLGVRNESPVLIESLSTGTSSLLINNEAYLTGFPAQLDFSKFNRRFTFEGMENYDDEVLFVAAIEGSLKAPTNVGVITFTITERKVMTQGSATLYNCSRIR